MKIHVADTDPRKITEPEVYKTNMGSFGIVADLFNRGLKEIGSYAEKEEADYVGLCDGLKFNLKYKDKKAFLIHVWDQINVLPVELPILRDRFNTRLVGLSNQVSNLWEKRGIDCKTAMPGCDTDFYIPDEKNKDQFTFLFDSFANVRSGADLALRAFDLAFRNNNDVKLIIKNTSDSEVFVNKINYYKRLGNNIDFIHNRVSFEEMGVLYQKAHVSLNIYRHSSWGLGIHQSAACNCIPLVGNFCPSNEMKVGIMLNPSKEIEIQSALPDLVNEWGLINSYGGFNYEEQPRFYDYSLEEYANLLKEVYWKYPEYVKKIPLRESVIENFSLKKCAEGLIEALS